MKKITTLLPILLHIAVFAQDNPTEKAQPIVAEGKRLYRSEMASWYGTDLFLEAYKNRNNIGGYFSYTNNEAATCIFFSRAENPKVIGTMIFDSTYNTKTATTDLAERDFTPAEKDYYLLRKKASEEIRADKLFETYKNTNLNLIPLISGDERKVYVLTGTSENGLVIFGNDYLLTFDKDNNVLTKKKLHKSLIPVNFGGKEEEGKEVVGSMHTHLPETGDFITATDICTLMLYEKFTKWKQHTVVSAKYMNIWNCLTDELTVIPLDAVDKKDKKKDKDE